MSEIEDKVNALRFELSQVKNHTDAAFRDRAVAIEAEIADWLTPGAPAEVPPSEHVDEPPAPTVVEAPPVALSAAASTDVAE